MSRQPEFATVDGQLLELRGDPRDSMTIRLPTGQMLGLVEAHQPLHDGLYTSSLCSDPRSLQDHLELFVRRYRRELKG